MLMLEKVKHVFFIGIGGYGMSALAKVLLHKDYTISGSDLKPSNLTRSLEKMGATIYYEHKKENVIGTDLVVYSTAIPEDNPELLECHSQKIPLWHRSDLLAQFINSHFGIAVTGTHGKTTTTAMITLILTEGGLDPTALVGGEVPILKSNARFGRSEYLVAEACESDHSFLRYHPEIAILTNVEADHLEFYDGDFSKLLEMYKDFLACVKPGGSIIYCADDKNTVEIMDNFSGEKITCALEKPAHYKASNLAAVKGCYSFDLVEKGNNLGSISLVVPGKHNVYNALTAAALARKLGIGLPAIKKALARYGGTKRRFQVLGVPGGITVIDDYAHHPTEVKATLEAACAYTFGRVIAVFQPHKYTRLNFFMDDFARSFEGPAMIILHDVYPAGEKVIEGINSVVLKEKISKEITVPIHHFSTHEEIISFLKDTVQKNDLVIFMGAGDISSTAYRFNDELQKFFSCGAS